MNNSATLVSVIDIHFFLFIRATPKFPVLIGPYFGPIFQYSWPLSGPYFFRPDTHPFVIGQNKGAKFFIKSNPYFFLHCLALTSKKLSTDWPLFFPKFSVLIILALINLALIKKSVVFFTTLSSH